MRARALAVALGVAGGAALGWLLAQRHMREHQEDLFSPRPLRRLAALGHLAASEGVETVRLLRDYLEWESQPMVLTFTGSLSVAEAGQADVQEMLRGALGCNIAWGIVDGFILVMFRVAERRRTYLVGRAVRESGDGAAVIQALRNWLPSEAVALLEPAHLDHMSADARLSRSAVSSNPATSKTSS